MAMQQGVMPRTVLTGEDVMVLVTTILRYASAGTWQPSPWTTVALMGLCREHGHQGLERKLGELLEQGVAQSPAAVWS
jgi:hypothetical protein